MSGDVVVLYGAALLCVGLVAGVLLAVWVGWAMRGERCPVNGKRHDYPISVEGQPWHFAPLHCQFCGQEFWI